MSTHSIAERAMTTQGWSMRKLLDVCLDYIDNQQDDAAFNDYLAQRAAADNRTSGAAVRSVSTVELP